MVTTKGRRRLSILASTWCLICLFFLCPSAMPADSERQKSGAVILNGQQLFVINTNLGPFSKEVRAANIVKRLEKVLADPDVGPDSISLLNKPNSTEIVAADVIIASVTDSDAKAASRPRQDLAEEFAAAIRVSVEKNRALQSFSGALENAKPSNFSKSFMNLVMNPLSLRFITVVIGALIISIFGWLFKRSIGSFVKESSQRYALRKIVTFTGYLLIFILALVVFKNALGNLALIVGAATAGIAFALKDVITSMAGWVAVTFGDFYKVGDRIQVGGIKGDVIDVGFGRTTLMELGEWVKGDLYTGRIVRVANSFIFREPMFNYSGDFPYLWDEITIPIKYGSDYKLADQLLKTVVIKITLDQVADAQDSWSRIERKYLVESARIEPMVTMVLNDNWIEFTVRYIVEVRQRRLTKDQLFRSILHEFDKTEGRVAFASATFQITDLPALDIRIKQAEAEPASAPEPIEQKD